MLHIYSLDLLVYFAMGICIVLGLLISGLLIAISYVAAVQAPDPEKTSPYECGFEPFDDARNFFDVKYNWLYWILRSRFIFNYFNYWFCVRMSTWSFRFTLIFKWILKKKQNPHF